MPFFLEEGDGGNDFLLQCRHVVILAYKNSTKRLLYGSTQRKDKPSLPCKSEISEGVQVSNYRPLSLPLNA